MYILLNIHKTVDACSYADRSPFVYNSIIRVSICSCFAGVNTLLDILYNITIMVEKIMFTRKYNNTNGIGAYLF